MLMLFNNDLLVVEPRPHPVCRTVRWGKPVGYGLIN